MKRRKLLKVAKLLSYLRNIHGANRSTTVALRVCASLGSARRPPAGDAGSGRVAMDLELRVVAFRVLFFTVVPFLILLSAGVLEVPEEHVTAVSNVLVSVPLPRKILRATRSSSTALSPALPSPPPAPSLPPGNDTRPSADVAASTPTVEETVPYCVIQIGNAGDRGARGVAFRPHPASRRVPPHVRQPREHHREHHLRRSLRRSRRRVSRRCRVVLRRGDDTLFFHRGVVRFAAQRRRQVTMKVAHGNEFNPTLAKKGWFTGGSGVALSRGMAEAAEARRAASGFRDVLAAEFKWCNCFDVPFMRGLSGWGCVRSTRRISSWTRAWTATRGGDWWRTRPWSGATARRYFARKIHTRRIKTGTRTPRPSRASRTAKFRRSDRWGSRRRRTYFESACERTRR